MVRLSILVILICIGFESLNLYTLQNEIKNLSFTSSQPQLTQESLKLFPLWKKTTHAEHTLYTYNSKKLSQGIKDLLLLVDQCKSPVTSIEVLVPTHTIRFRTANSNE